MVNFGTIMERISEKISERSPFGISKLVLTGRIQLRMKIGFKKELEILPP